MSQKEGNASSMFRFEDYKNEEDIEIILNKKFPVGTPKIKIDRFFEKIMGLEKSTPWHFNKETQRLEPNKGNEEYFLYYFKPDAKKKNQLLTGKYVKAVFLDEILAQELNYGVISREKGQGTGELILILRRENGHD